MLDEEQHSSPGNNQTNVVTKASTGDQKRSAAISPETHAVYFRQQQQQHKGLGSVHPPNDAEPSRTRQSAEEQSRSPDEPMSAFPLVPLTESAESRAQRPSRKKTLGGGSDTGGPGYWSLHRQPGCLLQETRTHNWAKTHFYGFAGNEAEKGKEGGERAFQHDSRALEAVGGLV